MKMKTTVVSIVFFVLVFQANAQEMDTVACRIVEKSLKIVDSYLANNNSSDVGTRASIVSFLTKLTGIPSQSNGNYIGQHSPTKHDYDSWLKWYILNKEHVYWNAATKKVILKKEIVVPGILSSQ